MRALRVVLADDHRIVREGIEALLTAPPPAGAARIDVVGQAATGPEALALCRALAPDVVVLDLGLPELSGIEVMAALRAAEAPPRVVVLSMHATAEHVRRAREGGAAAYVVKGSGVRELAAAIRRATEGGFGPFPSAADPLAELTAREREVLVEIALGGSNREIAQRLGISIHTVNSHRVHLMEKLDLHDVAALTRFAVRLGLLA
ncbi:MAG: response regulator [Deltaproteobacteria bacterium]